MSYPKKYWAADSEIEAMIRRGKRLQIETEQSFRRMRHNTTYYRLEIKEQDSHSRFLFGLIHAFVLIFAFGGLIAILLHETF